MATQESNVPVKPSLEFQSGSPHSEGSTKRHFVHVKLNTYILIHDENPWDLDPETITLLLLVEVEGHTGADASRKIYTEGKHATKEGRARSKLAEGKAAVAAFGDTVLASTLSDRVRKIAEAILSPKPKPRREPTGELVGYTNLRKGLLLLDDDNPWNLNPVEFTILCWQLGLGKKARYIALDLYTDGATQSVSKRVNTITRNGKKIILTSGINPNELLDYNVRIFELWKVVQSDPDLRVPRDLNQVHLWEELLAEECPPLLSEVANERDLSQYEKPTPEETFEEEEEEPEDTLATNQVRESVPTTPQPPRNDDSNEPKASLPRVCPRCRGSMIPERDWYGAYSTCLQCGYVYEAVSAPPIEILEEDNKGRRQRRRQPSHGKIRL